jgi:hypothetical protein
MSILGQFGLWLLGLTIGGTLTAGLIGPGQAVGMVGVCRVRYDGAWRRRCRRDGAHGAVGLEVGLQREARPDCGTSHGELREAKARGLLSGGVGEVGAWQDGCSASGLRHLDDGRMPLNWLSLERNVVTMREKVTQFRRQVQDCKDRAAGARSPIDSDAWLKLAEEWLALANANEAARDVQNSPTVNERPASE